MSPSFWSDEDRLFVPRFGGWSINFKYIAKKFGWIKAVAVSEPLQDESPTEPETAEDRLKQAVERSRYEDR